VNFITYVLFGILLTVLVSALHERLKVRTQTLSQIAAIFGVVWVGLMIASGMISNIGIAAVLELAVKDPEQAMTLLRAINTVVEGIGGGNEIVGGLWILLLSIAALKGNELHKTLNYLGVFVGIVGILTIYPAGAFTEIFGISQLAWFAWLEIFMLTNSEG